MRYLGGVAGIAVLGQVLVLSGGRDVVLHSHHIVLAVFAGALLVGLLCAAVLPGAPGGDRATTHRGSLRRAARV